MKYTLVQKDGFKKMQVDAGVVLSEFDVETGEALEENILGLTSGGLTFNAVPAFRDRAEGIDNVPKNTMEFMEMSDVDVKLTATFVSVDPEFAAFLASAADVEGDKITPRKNLKLSDFRTLWIVGNYGDANTGDAGYVAIEMKNVLSTGGFQMKTSDNGNGQFSATLTGHYSLADMDKIPYNIYIHSGTAAAE